ncbi:protein-glutamate methylesterase/protein-glutamine glutaminase [Nitrincola alkalilacustris]|uniref:protein-glutamate methylesterase/protein-glutamine glutaminase n=1 Tax=Nitrincola alkalilacustris TaxID=1571224 RepID=UPI00124D0BE7|nr:chemotaxis response regulator protein-glutamate methylesterase [Nitrincola alkalilacustris]
MPGSKIRVLVVDDSALIRRLLTEIINQQPDMQVVAAARDAYEARDMVRKLKPDVITLDIEMPRVDGLTFLEKLMSAQPTPVVMISTLTEAGADITLRALDMGAVDFIPKPRLGVEAGLSDFSALIADKVRAAAMSKLAVTRVVTHRTSGKPHPQAPTSVTAFQGTELLIGVGASTGGTVAIQQLLSGLPAFSPAVLVTQHMPAGFTRSFAQRLNSLCEIRVKEAEDGERILPGYAYIAPGDQHMRIKRSGANYHVVLGSDAAVNRHRPSVDVMFDSMAEVAPLNTIATLLTGMGRDGAEGLLRLRNAGAFTLAQDEISSVVYGMPRAAAEIGAAELIEPLDRMAGEILSWVAQKGRGVRV